MGDILKIKHKQLSSLFLTIRVDAVKSSEMILHLSAKYDVLLNYNGTASTDGPLFVREKMFL